MSRERQGRPPLGRRLERRRRAASTVAAATTLLMVTTLLALTALLTVTALPAAGTVSAVRPAAGPVAHSVRTCSPPKYPGLGYFTSLTVSGVGCATGGKLIVAYYHCRTRSGPSGHCHGTVLGYSCSERRNSIPTEIDGRVTCHRRSATVIHTYQQDI
jgi:hypothetical protein